MDSGLIKVRTGDMNEILGQSSSHSHFCRGREVVFVCVDPLCAPVPGLFELFESHCPAFASKVHFQLTSVVGRCHHEMVLAHHCAPEICQINRFQIILGRQKNDMAEK